MLSTKSKRIVDYIKRMQDYLIRPAVQKKKEELPQLDLTARNEREVNRKIAAKLDQTINRLEMLLTEEN